MARAPLLAALALVGLVAVAHGGGLSATFVYDDHRFVVQNPAVHELDLVAAFTDPKTASVGDGIRPDVYRPLRTVLFALLHAVAGLEPLLWHLASLLLHAVNALLLFSLLRPLVGGRLVPALAGAAVFAVHPVGVESVAWISSQGDLLALTFMLLALIVLERPGALRTGAGALLAVLACFAKESALVLPGLLLLRDLALPEGALPLGTRARRVLLLGALAGAFLALRLVLIEGLAQVEEFPGGSRLAAARGMLAGLVFYARALVAPAGFPFDLHLALPLSWTEPAVVLGVGLLGTLLLAGGWALARGRGLLAFATWGALVALVPVSNVLVPLKALVAERFLYPVLVPFAAGVALAVLAATRRLGAWTLLPVVVLVVLGAGVARERTVSWSDDLTLWERVLGERPDHMRAYEGLGYEYARRGRVTDAENAYRSYLEYNPADAKSMMILGDTFGGLADSLQETRRDPAIETDIAAKRRLARMAQLSMYREAVATWRRVGLTTGRGSPALLRETLRKIIAAAVELGDLPKAKEANDALLALEGVDPADASGVLARGSPARVRVRLNLALTALLVPVPPGLGREQHEQRVLQRAAVLRDVGVDPRQDRRSALESILPLYRAHAGRPAANLEDQVNLASLLLELGRRGEARELLETLRQRHPERQDLRRLLEEAGVR